MATYDPEDLVDDWEFKIVRATSPIFARPDIFQRLLEEEARAGWIMVEKFDDTRIRFKRRRSEREYDSERGDDLNPYRTHFSTYVYTSTVTIVLLVMIVITLLFFFLLTR
jgi:hypothetical protein